MLPSMSMIEAQPPKPTHDKSTTPWPDGKSEHLMVPSWNSLEGLEKADKSPLISEEELEDELELELEEPDAAAADEVEEAAAEEVGDTVVV